MNKPKIQFILNISPLKWVLLGFLISYLFFFIRPIFFSSNTMQFLIYVPAINPIGIDLKQILSYSESWFIFKHTPYIGGNLYPPLATIFFTPFLFINFSLAYKFVTLVSVFCYIMMTFAFPYWISKGGKVSPLLMLFFVTGLFSYGFQFELERGQFNVIAMFLCLFAIWIYHYKNNYRYLAYFLFIISVQLKIFPFIYIFMFITDWHDWEKNIKRFLALSILNFALFFILGFKIFFDFIVAIKAQTIHPYIWTGNHSIRSFVKLFNDFVSKKGWTWINQYSGLVQLLLVAITCVCIFLIIFLLYRKRENGINPYLLLACTIGALILPSVSHDYKLSILTAPVAVLMLDKHFFSLKGLRLHQHIFSISMIFIISFAYFSTLFSYTNKPSIITNNFPALMTILLATTFLFLVNERKH